jgi:hypothetical protein
MNMAETTPQYNTPHVLAKPHSTYLGNNDKIQQEINTKGAALLEGKSLTMHINSPDALVPDARYVGNKDLDSARKNAVQWTIEVAKAEGVKLADGVKENYASAMNNLRNVHHEIIPHLPFDADQLAKSDVVKVLEIAAHKLGKKGAVIAGFLTSSASFAGEAIDLSGRIVNGEHANTDKLKTLGSAVIDKGVEGAMGVVDPLGVINTKEMSHQLQNGSVSGIATAFNEARLKAASELADVAIEYSR